MQPLSKLENNLLMAVQIFESKIVESKHKNTIYFFPDNLCRQTMEKTFSDSYNLKTGQPDEQRLLAELVANTREPPEFLH